MLRLLPFIFFSDICCNTAIQKLAYSSQYSNYAAGWTVQDSRLSMGKNFFFFLSEISRLLGDSPSLLFIGYKGSNLEKKWPGYDHPYPVLRLRMTGPVLLLPLDAVMAWTGKTLLYDTV
jgi:hypothetical protein